MSPLAPREIAERIVFSALLDGYVRELGTGLLSQQEPRHDPELAELFRARGRTRWVRVPVDAAGLDIHCPVDRISAVGRYHFDPPAAVRRRGETRLAPLGLLDFAAIIVEAHPHRQGRTGAGMIERLAETVDKLAFILEHRDAADDAVGLGSFLESEQALVLGHANHPLAKSRWGFTLDDVRRYSPEMGGWFSLHYFLAHPSIAREESAASPPPSAVLRSALLAHAGTPAEVRELILTRPDWPVIPAHPWEAPLLRRLPQIEAAIAGGLLVSLGALGDTFSATSSVRTVHRPDAEMMLKLSLHVAVTNCERVNHLHEMEKAVDVARLLATPWGDAVRRDFPALQVIADPGYLAIELDGETVEGLRTVTRENPFHGGDRAYVAASLCEAEVARRSSLATLVRRVALARGASLEDAAMLWFERYVEILLGSVIGVYSRHGLALEAHQQNMLVGVDEAGLPDRVYFRDSQGVFFRSGREEELKRHLPSLRNTDRCVIPEAYLHGPFTYYLLVNNVFGFVDALVTARLAREEDLLRAVKARLLALLPTDETGFVKYLLESPRWPVKANLKMQLEGINEATEPNETSALFAACENPLLALDHACEGLLRPPAGVLYRRVVPRCDATFEIRGFDPAQDLDVIHRWVNEDYTRRFWQMNGPPRVQEEFYLELMASAQGHPFVGLVDGELAFSFETYWAIREPVGHAAPDEVRPSDYGFHILVGPPRVPRPNFTFHVVQVVMELMFRHPEVGRLVGEGNRDHEKLHRLVTRAGFELAREIQLPDKIANLTFCTRAQFLQRCPDSEPFLRGTDAAGDRRPSR